KISPAALGKSKRSGPMDRLRIAPPNRLRMVRDPRHSRLTDPGPWINSASSFRPSAPDQVRAGSARDLPPRKRGPEPMNMDRAVTIGTRQCSVVMGPGSRSRRSLGRDDASIFPNRAVQNERTGFGPVLPTRPRTEGPRRSGLADRERDELGLIAGFHPHQDGVLACVLRLLQRLAHIGGGGHGLAADVEDHVAGTEAALGGGSVPGHLRD